MLSLMYLVAKVWIDGPEGSWKHGVKDLHQTPSNTSSRLCRCTIFGYKHLDNSNDTCILLWSQYSHLEMFLHGFIHGLNK
jgi:hypothetical protein